MNPEPVASHPLMASTAELAQFWRALAGLVVSSERGEGRRVDLLGCRMEEDADEGAALLKVRECWQRAEILLTQNGGGCL